MPGFFSDRTEDVAFASIEAVQAGSKLIMPEDRDAARFVEKISRQHGSVVPGLADEAEFATLSLKLTDGTERLIYAQRLFNDDAPDMPMEEIRDFIEERVS